MRFRSVTTPPATRTMSAGAGAKVVVPCSCCSPHNVVLQQVRVDEHTQLGAVTKGRHATVRYTVNGVSHDHWSYHQIHEPWL
jgi:hypothetical protein